MCIKYVENTHEGSMKINSKEVKQELPKVAIEVEPKTLNEKLLALRHMNELKIAALGDSSVFGVGDTSTDGNPDGPGWVGRVAHDLAAKQYINLSKNGARAHTVVSTQLVSTQFFNPDLVCVCVGMNDVMRGNYSPVQIRDSIRTLIQELNAIGAVVVMLGLPDPSKVAFAPKRVKKVLSRRVQNLNEILQDVSAKEDALFIAGWEQKEVYERSFWHVDRMHPSSLGHQLVADLIRNHLNLPLRVANTLPTQSIRTQKDDLIWLLTSGTKWLLKRSIDLIPTLIYLIMIDGKEIRAIEASKNATT
jgi:lysophospholipase L1-like esterase